MKLRASVVTLQFMAITVVAISSPQAALELSDEALAGALANENTRQSAVDQVAASNGKQVPLLLSWAQSPPAGVDAYGLDAGLADVFGRLRTKKAIPFLVSHITVFRSRAYIYYKERIISVDRTAQVESNMPAAAALIRIGREALAPLYKAYYEPTTSDERCALLLVINRINDPDSLDFFRRARQLVDQERAFATDALRAAGEDRGTTVRPR